MAKTEMPDLILMDMSLPVLDGWGATRQIKAEASTQSIPLIALTAHAMAGDRDKALQAGCDDYDTKPIELARLLDKMDRLLNERTAERSSPSLNGNASRGESLAHLRHELRTPVNHILGYSELLIEERG